MPSGLLNKDQSPDFLEKISDEVIDIEADYILALRLEISDVFEDETENLPTSVSNNLDPKVLKVIEELVSQHKVLTEDVLFIYSLLLRKANITSNPSKDDLLVLMRDLMENLHKHEIQIPKDDNKEAGEVPQTAENTQDIWTKVPMDESVKKSGGSGAAPAEDERGGLVARGGSPESQKKLIVPKAEKRTVDVSGKGEIEKPEPLREETEDMVLQTRLRLYEFQAELKILLSDWPDWGDKYIKYDAVLRNFKISKIDPITDENNALEKHCQEIYSTFSNIKELQFCFVGLTRSISKEIQDANTLRMLKDSWKTFAETIFNQLQLRFGYNKSEEGKNIEIANLLKERLEICWNIFPEFTDKNLTWEIAMGIGNKLTNTLGGE